MDQRSANFFKSQMVSSLGSGGHLVLVATTQLGLCSVKAVLTLCQQTNVHFNKALFVGTEISISSDTVMKQYSSFDCCSTT